MRKSAPQWTRRSTQCIPAIFCAVVAAMLFADPATAGGKQQEKPQLSFEIAVHKSLVTDREPFILEGTITNISEKPVRIYKAFAMHITILLFIRDSHNNTVEWIGPHIDPGPIKAKWTGILAPGASTAFRINNVEQYCRISTPGLYTGYAIYGVTPFYDSDKELHLWEGMLRSNTIKFVITRWHEPPTLDAGKAR